MCEHRGWPGPDDDWSQYEVQNASFARPEGVPFQPPVTQVADQDDESATFTDGALLTADWIHKDIRLEQRPTEPWPWPASDSFKSPCHVRMLTDKQPFSVTIIGYEEVDHDTGEPEIRTGIRYECGRAEPRPCVHLNDDGFVEIHPIPIAILHTPYLIVFATWSIHPFERGDQPGDPATASASWLFHFPEN